MMREALVAAAMFSQVLPGASSTSTSAPVSPAVMATDMCVIDSEGNGTLELLVLWRGTPGWFRRGGGGASGGGGSGTGSAMGDGNGARVRTEWLSQGGVELRVKYDAASRKGWIQDQEIDLNDANVVLVDDVDAPTGPRVVGVLRIDPSYRALMEPPPAGVPAGPRGMRERPQPVPVHTFIRRSPELVEYLKCDVRLPDLQPYEQQVFERWCASVKQP